MFWEAVMNYRFLTTEINLKALYIFRCLFTTSSVKLFVVTVQIFVYKFLFTIVFSLEKGKTTLTKPFTFLKWKHILKTNHISEMKAHSETHFENENMFDNWNKFKSLLLYILLSVVLSSYNLPKNLKENNVESWILNLSI